MDFSGQYDGYVDEVNTAMRQAMQIYGRDAASFTQKVLMPQVEEDDLVLAKKAQQMTGVTLKLLKLLQKEQRHKMIGTQTMLDLIGSEFKQLQQAYSKPTEFRKSETLNEYLKAAFGEIPGDASIDERVKLINKHIAEKTETDPVQAAEHEHAAVAKVFEELEDYKPGEKFYIHPAGAEDEENLELDADREEHREDDDDNEDVGEDGEDASFIQLGGLDASFRMGSLTYEVELLNNEGRLLELAKFIAPQMDYIQERILRHTTLLKRQSSLVGEPWSNSVGLQVLVEADVCSEEGDARTQINYQHPWPEKTKKVTVTDGTIMGTFDIGISRMDTSEDVDIIAHKPDAEKLVSADGELVYSGDGEFDTSAVTGLDGILDEKEVVVADFLLYELGVI
ncbi:hypothetical protein Pmar_PMAR019918 [Perkinsus marinus ATCC 50983]|uniref:Uncharacterized protein n=1 Tax=Perkinsus marinus (strain ATCC 50983 / TXsc) TaxID=423536 RepID=C5KC04_PERM5|nr:hypothetical protein Pmar_PMAR019918 [Perkinsus marinus ATCC 50983]EER18035.1 hypothetical protein Pmar_PMAR019918 [Perkinsus marinus ATCC 50983]|eukprot:XP_002786239.1 hypothetical protein Pmar_PMAR019918 [Perkinsus marinus ATCC 50983]